MGKTETGKKETAYKNVRAYEVGDATSKWLECKLHLYQLYSMVMEQHYDIYGNRAENDDIGGAFYKLYAPMEEYIDNQISYSIQDALGCRANCNNDVVII